LQNGVTPLLAAAGAGQAETVQLLLQSGADVNSVDQARILT
jgi:ankyrin repeat protein